MKDAILKRCIPEPNTGCWLWAVGGGTRGYGLVYDKTAHKYRLAHRVAYEEFIGPIPAGMDILHRCDQPCCVNPDHLRPGTHAENMADAVRKGRITGSHIRGEKANFAKLTEADVRLIRSTHRQTKRLAEQLGVSLATIKHIRRRVTWTHI